MGSDEEPFSALAFKIMTDPFVGTLTFARIYSGVLSKGSQVLNSVSGKKERGFFSFMHLFRAMHRSKELGKPSQESTSSRKESSNYLFSYWLHIFRHFSSPGLTPAA